jgi:hypothetical protein
VSRLFLQFFLVCIAGNWIAVVDILMLGRAL